MNVRVRRVGHRVRPGKQAEVVLDVAEVRHQPGQREPGQYRGEPPWPDVSRGAQRAHPGDEQIGGELVTDDHRRLQHTYDRYSCPPCRARGRPGQVC